MDDDTKEVIIFFSTVGGIIVALTGWGLSFTTLPLLVIGGIICTVVTLSIIIALAVSEFLSKNKGELSKKDIICICAASSAVGAIIAVAISAIPAVASKASQVEGALIGAAVGIIAPIISLFLIDKVNEYVISPILERFYPKEHYIDLQNR